MTVQKQVAIGTIIAGLLALPMFVMVVQRWRSQEADAIIASANCPQVKQALGEPIARVYPSHCTAETGFCVELRGPKARGELHWQIAGGRVRSLSLRLADTALNLDGCAGVK